MLCRIWETIVLVGALTVNNELKSVQALGRKYLLDQLPSAHRFALSSCFEHGEPVVINALRGIGYNWNTARQLYLAYQEQKKTQDEA